MDYFSELLSSYDQLKKRTFKLRFISEAEEKKDTDKKTEDKKQDIKQYAAPAIEAFDAALKGKPQQGVGNRGNLNFVLSQQADKVKKKAAKVNISGSNLARNGHSMTRAEFWSEVNSPYIEQNKSSTGYKVLAAWGGSDGAGSAESTAQEGEDEAMAAAQEQQKKEQRKKVGGFLEQQGLLEGFGPHRVVYELGQVKANIENYCNANQALQFNDPSLQNMCARANSYVAAGEGGMGLEYKLGTAQARTVVDTETGETKSANLTASVRLDIARSANFLTSWLTDLDPKRCADVTQKIGSFGRNIDDGGKLVLFGSEPSDAVVLGKPNAPQRLALKNIQKVCKDQYDALPNLVGDSITDKEKNAVKGTFFEAILVFQTKAHAAQALTGTARKKALTDAVTELKDEIKKNLRVLKAVVGDWEANPERGQSIDEAFDISVQEEALMQLTGDAKELTESFMKEIRAAAPFIDFMDADGIQHGGKISKTGQRADLMFTFNKNNRAKAEEKAASVGSSVIELKDKEGNLTGEFGVPVGLKRIEKLKGPKFGEINSRERMLALVIDSPALQGDPNIDEGFQESMRRKIFPDTQEGRDREQRMVDYALELEEDLLETTKQLVDGATYIDDQGNIKSQNPESMFGSLARQLLDTIDLKSAKTSLITKAFFYEEGDSLVLKPFEGDSQESVDYRRRGQELIMRVARFTRLQNDANGVPRSDDDTPEEIEQRQQAARDYMIKSALVCGANTDDMTQLIVTDRGQALPVEHNAAFDAICQANNSGEGAEFEFSESGVNITGGGLTVGFKQEHAGTGEPPNEKSNTRSEARMSKKTIEATVADISTPENSSTLMQYLEGQMRLLETLINQAK